MSDELMNQAADKMVETERKDVLDGNTWVDHNHVIMVTDTEVHIVDTNDDEAVILSHVQIARIHRRIKSLNPPDTKTGVMF